MFALLADLVSGDNGDNGDATQGLFGMNWHHHRMRHMQERRRRADEQRRRHFRLMRIRMLETREAKLEARVREDEGDTSN